MTTILVTGGAGFIGSTLVDHLLARGDRVICLDNFNDFYLPARKRHNIAHHADNPNFVLAEGDLRDRDFVMGVFADHEPTRIAHLGAMANVRYSIERAALYNDVNVQGTTHLLDGARQTGAESFVLASTSSIYGRTTESPFLEDQDTNHPLAPYPATKKAAEVMGHAYHNMFGLNVTVLRFFTAYGPRVRPDMMAYMVMDRILKRETITLYNGGEMHRDWTYVDDVVQGVSAALDTPLGYEVLNIGRGEPVRLGDFVEIIEELVGQSAIVEHVPAPPSEPPLTFANIDKARRLLGYQPHTSIADGLSHTWDWFRALPPELRP